MEDITRKIIGSAYEVYNHLGFGFLESVYKKAMIIELAKKNLKVEEERPLKVYYNNQVVGDFYVDLFVEEVVIVELKSVQNLAKEHEVQLVNYLKGLNQEIGLLINFSPSGVDVRRKYRHYKQEGRNPIDPVQDSFYRQDVQDRPDNYSSAFPDERHRKK